MLCLVVRTLSAQTCVFIFRVFAAGHTDSYNIRETETKERLSGKFCTYEQRIILMGFSVLERDLSGVVFRDFRRYKSYHFLKLIRGRV